MAHIASGNLAHDKREIRLYALCALASCVIHAALLLLWPSSRVGGTAAVILLESGEVAFVMMELGNATEDSAPAPMSRPLPATVVEAPPRIEPAAMRPPDAPPFPEKIPVAISFPSPQLDFSEELLIPEQPSPPRYDSAPPARRDIPVSRTSTTASLPPQRDIPATVTVRPHSDPSPAMTAGGDYRSRGVKQRAMPQGGFAIRYPERARRRGESGVTLVAATIAADGRCLSAEVERSSGYSELDAAALAAVRGARFSPAREGGVPVVAQDRFEIVFQLHGR